MRSFARGLLRHKWLVLIVFAIVLGASLIAAPHVQVNYTLSDYLPDDAPSTIGFRLMEEEFHSSPSNLRILIESVSVAEALVYKDQIKQIDGIQDVTWLDDSVNVRQPLDMIDQDTLDAWYKDGHALITAYVADDVADCVIEAVWAIIGERGHLSGDSVQSLSTRQNTTQDIMKTIMIVVPMIFIILLFSTNSYFEPVLFLTTIGVAIMIGKGTDLLLGEVSFITNSCSAILQLAISMDYAIFLLEAFGENKEKGLDTFDAMTEAVAHSASSILSSSITTIMGFAVMVFMEFKVGYDMGIVLAKDIVISLICVIVLLPVLALVSSGLIEKTRHRPLLPGFKGFGKVISRLCIPVAVIVAIIVVIPSYMANDHVDFVYGTTKMITDPGTRVVQDEKRIDELFDMSSQMVLMVPGGDMSREKMLVDALDALPDISSIVSYAGMAGTTIPIDFVGRDAVSALVGDNYDRMILTTNIELESDRSFRLVEDVRAVAEQFYPGDNYLTGGTANIYDMRTTVLNDDIVVNGLALLSIGLVLLISMRSISLPLILLMAIKSSVWINVAVPYFGGNSLYYISSLIINAIQLGATVDYAILLTGRYLENRRQMLRLDAIAATVTSSTSSILTSASILFVGGMTLGQLSSVSVVSQLGVLVGRGALISAFMVMTVLPGLLMLLDPLIRATTLRAGFMTKRKLRTQKHQQAKEEIDREFEKMRQLGTDDPDDDSAHAITGGHQG